MSKIEFIENKYKTTPKFRDSNIKGYYCFGSFNRTEYFEICTTSNDERSMEGHHYRQVIDIDKESAIKLIELLKENFKI
jgi:hypothetical protein